MNELSIHIIADLQFHARHHGIPKVPIRGFSRIYDIVVQALPGKPPLLFQGPQESEKSVPFKVRREMGGQTKFFYCNVKILLHHQPNSFND